MSEVQQCLVLIKPDGLVKSLTGDVISKLAETKLRIVGAKVVSVKREFAEKHYCRLKQEQTAKHGAEKGTRIYEDTLKYIMGGFHNTNRVLAMVYEGDDAIDKIRKIAGATNPEKAEPHTIRGKYGRVNSQTGIFENVMHSSESVMDAEREIKLWFTPDELTSHIYDQETKAIMKEHKVWK
jgi:nucleoside-diphosphate kinase